MKAVIFDFDGTLVDTMPLHYEAYRRTFAEAGLELSSAAFFAAIGGNAAETIPKLLAGRPCSLSVDEIHQRKKQIVQELFAEQPIPVLEAARLLGLLAGKFRLALASSGARPGIEQILRRLDWLKYFDAIVTGEDAPRGKPHPDLFLLAAERLKIPAAECFVFEDTDAGVESARRAGMAVFDVRRTTAACERGEP